MRLLLLRRNRGARHYGIVYRPETNPLQEVAGALGTIPVNLFFAEGRFSAAGAGQDKLQSCPN
jgi:hypothetical protein